MFDRLSDVLDHIQIDFVSESLKVDNIKKN